MSRYKPTFYHNLRVSSLNPFEYLRSEINNIETIVWLCQICPNINSWKRMTMSGLRQEAAENTQNKFKDVFKTTTTTPPLPATTTLTHCKVIYLSPPKKAKTKKPNLFATFNCALKLYSSFFPQHFQL